MVNRYKIAKSFYSTASLFEVACFVVGGFGMWFAPQNGIFSVFATIMLIGLALLIPGIFCILEFFERNANLKLLNERSEEEITKAGSDNSMVGLGIAAWAIAVVMIVFTFRFSSKYLPYFTMSEILFFDILYGVIVLCWGMLGAHYFHKRLNGLYCNRKDEANGRRKRESAPGCVVRVVLYLGLSALVSFGLDALANYSACVPDISPKQSVITVQAGEMLNVDELVDITCKEDDRVVLQKGIETMMLFDGREIVDQTDAKVSEDQQSVFVGNTKGTLEITVWATGVEHGESVTIQLEVQ